MRIREVVRQNGLWAFFAALFVLALCGQAVAGFVDHNQQQIAEGAAAVSFARYLTSSNFATAFISSITAAMAVLKLWRLP